MNTTPHPTKHLVVLGLVVASGAALAQADEAPLYERMQRVALNGLDNAIVHRATLSAEQETLSRTADELGEPATRGLSLSSVRLQYWLGSGRANFGVGAGAFGVGQPQQEPGQAPGSSFAGPMLSLGMRYQVDDGAVVFADTSGLHRLHAAGSDPSEVYKTRVGLEFRSADSTARMLKQRALSMQLDSGYRVSLKPRSRGVQIVLRGDF